MTKYTNPYKSQPERSFWRAAVGGRHFNELINLWDPMRISKSDLIATAGSCFAQHIGNNLALRGAHWMDLEPPPPIFDSVEEARRWGFSVFSCRYGNIYTVKQLLQLFDEAYDNRVPQERVWERDGLYFDALRPAVEPIGQDSPQLVLELRSSHLDAVRRMFADLDVFIFTLGLTEGWEFIEDGTIYQMAPGVVAGNYDSTKYRFRNFRHEEILKDFIEFKEKLLKVNPKARILLTVSPVPLAATATENHVLVASSYSKSVLRAVAGDLAQDCDNVFYFPSFEIINSHPSRGMYFEPDLRGVNRSGVDYVMSHFFSGVIGREFTMNSFAGNENSLELICDEDNLDEG